MIRSLRKFARLDAGRRALLVAAFVSVCRARVAVAVLPFRRLLPPPAVAAAPRFRPESVAWAVDAAANRIPGSRCLVRALAARRLLARYGYPARLRFGAAGANGFTAHAWLELPSPAPPLTGAHTAPLYTPLVTIE